MSEQFDPADYSFVVKRQGNPQKPWRWEIYCAGKSAAFLRACSGSQKEKKAFEYFLAKQGRRALK